MTINDLFKQINLLSKEKTYTFRNKSNRNEFKYVKRDINKHALYFLRVQGERTSLVSVSERNLLKIAEKVRPYVPFQIDVIVGASGNWRSLFESALAYTPQFYACTLNNQRHLIWAPEHPHELNVLSEADVATLKVFSKQSRYNDFKYYMDNCYAFDNCYELFKNGLTTLLTIFRQYDSELYSIYDISEVDRLKELINKAETLASQNFHAPLHENKSFCLYDIAIAYQKFLVAKKYFAYY